MPELPEVEMTVRQLHRFAVDRKINSVQVLDPRLIRPFSRTAFESRLTGASILSARRRGKFILLDTSSSYTILTHLRMTGSFGFGSSKTSLPRFTRILFHLDHEERLVFLDPRRFGVMKLVEKDRIDSLPELTSLGIDPFSADFTPEKFFQILQSSSQPVKIRLLNQKGVAGLGNIYSQEALFRAKIHPQTPSNKIPKSKANQLRKIILQILTQAIDRMLTQTSKNPQFMNEGELGTLSHFLKVYGRSGEKCFRCKTNIRKLTQGQRSTYFCPHCQKR